MISNIGATPVRLEVSNSEVQSNGALDGPIALDKTLAPGQSIVIRAVSVVASSAKGGRLYVLAS